MKFLRRDRIQNTKLREILRLDKIHDEIEDSKIRWYGHVERMNAENMPRQTLENRLEWKTPRGWATYRWEEQFRKTAEKRQGIK